MVVKNKKCFREKKNYDKLNNFLSKNLAIFLSTEFSIEKSGHFFYPPKYLLGFRKNYSKSFTSFLFPNFIAYLSDEYVVLLRTLPLVNFVTNFCFDIAVRTCSNPSCLN